MKVFISVVNGYEYSNIIGVSSTLEAAWSKHEPKKDEFNEWRKVIECLVDHPGTLKAEWEGSLNKGLKYHHNPYGLSKI